MRFKRRGESPGQGLALLHKAPAMPAFTSTASIMQIDGDGKVKVMIGAIDIGQEQILS